MSRIASFLAVRLAYGAITTSVVAWLLAAIPGVPNRPLTALPGFQMRGASAALRSPTVGGPTHWHASELSRFGARDLVVAPVTEPSPDDCPLEELLPADARAEIAVRTEPTNWSGEQYLVYQDRGWPLPALRSQWDWFARTAWPRPRLATGIPFGPSPAADLWPFGVVQLRALPVRPLWVPFLLDTVFFAILSCVTLAPALIRRRLRRGRGACPACGYPRRVSAACPECGASDKST